MARRRKRQSLDEPALDMTPMIDIIFQLLIFFLLSAKFIALEGQLAAYLPKDKGNDPTPQTQELTSVLLDLTWTDENGGTVVCETLDYRTREGERLGQRKFPTIDATQSIEYGPPGKSAKVTIPYHVPDFAEIEEYLAYRKASYADPQGTGLPVTVSFDNRVRAQVVVTILDICHRLNITNFTIQAKELE